MLFISTSCVRIGSFQWEECTPFKGEISGMGDANPSVLVIDDDPEFRDSVARLLRTVRLETRQFSSVSDFLKVDPPEGPTCLVLDVRMPGEAVLSFSATLPLRTGKCRSSSS